MNREVPRRFPQTLRDFFLYEQRMEADKFASQFFTKLLKVLIVANVILGSMTLYDRFIYTSEDPILIRYANEVPYRNEI